ncbi:DNA damage-inducible transcript 3 protein [Narcine bancroftii]|uniref:DNA damage-inducible transcript 3 protein n=1 Tax=Narcine bancroftii TaxID=1343680 RepID=UPI003831F460
MLETWANLLASAVNLRPVAGLGLIPAAANSGWAARSCHSSGRPVSAPRNRSVETSDDVTRVLLQLELCGETPALRGQRQRDNVALPLLPPYGAISWCPGRGVKRRRQKEREEEEVELLTSENERLRGQVNELEAQVQETRKLLIEMVSGGRPSVRPSQPQSPSALPELPAHLGERCSQNIACQSPVPGTGHNTGISPQLKVCHSW